MHMNRTDELPQTIEEVGEYDDDKLTVETWHDPAGGQSWRVTLKTTPPAEVFKIRLTGDTGRVDVYRPGKWEQWLKATLVELRTQRERDRLARQVAQEQEEARRFAPVDDADLFG